MCNLERLTGLDKEIQHKIHMRKLRTFKKQEMKGQMIQAEHIADLSGLRYKNEGSNES